MQIVLYHDSVLAVQLVHHWGVGQLWWRCCGGGWYNEGSDLKWHFSSSKACRHVSKPVHLTAYEKKWQNRATWLQCHCHVERLSSCIHSFVFGHLRANDLHNVGKQLPINCSTYRVSLAWHWIWICAFCAPVQHLLSFQLCLWSPPTLERNMWLFMSYMLHYVHQVIANFVSYLVLQVGNVHWDTVRVQCEHSLHAS